MIINEVVDQLNKLKEEHGDIDVRCINNDGPGCCWEDCIVEPDRVKYDKWKNEILIGDFC